MTRFDTIIRGGRISTELDTFHCDIGIRDGRIVALGEQLGSAATVIDATGKWALSGGIDSRRYRERDPLGGTRRNTRGGYYLWVELPPGLDDLALARRASEHGIFIAPGTVFMPERQHLDVEKRPASMRVNVAYADNATFMSFLEAELRTAS